MKNIEKIYEVISEERKYQNEKWGGTPSQGIHNTGEYLNFIQYHLQQAIIKISTESEPKATTLALDEIRKITALGVACMQQNGYVRRGYYTDAELLNIGDKVVIINKNSKHYAKTYTINNFELYEGIKHILVEETDDSFLSQEVALESITTVINYSNPLGKTAIHVISPTEVKVKPQIVK